MSDHICPDEANGRACRCSAERRALWTPEPAEDRPAVLPLWHPLDPRDEEPPRGH
jgi:hypothetical protein